MTFSAIADTMKLRELSAILDEYCMTEGYGDKDPEREEAARQLMSLFQSGTHDIDHLRSAFEAIKYRF